MDFFVARLMSLNQHELTCLRSDPELQGHLQRTHLMMESKLQQISNASAFAPMIAPTTATATATTTNDSHALDLRLSEQQQNQLSNQQRQQQQLDQFHHQLQLQLHHHHSQQHQQQQQLQLHQHNQRQLQQQQLYHHQQQQQQQQEKCFNYKKMKFIEWTSNGIGGGSGGSHDNDGEPCSPTPPASSASTASSTNNLANLRDDYQLVNSPPTTTTNNNNNNNNTRLSTPATKTTTATNNHAAALTIAAALPAQPASGGAGTGGKKYKGEFDEPSALEVELRLKLLMRLDNYHSKNSPHGECACILGSEFRDKTASSVLVMVEQWRQMPTEQRVTFKWDMNDLPKDIPLSDIKRFENLRREASSGRADFGGASKRKPLGIRGTRQFLLILYCLWGHPGRDDPMQREGYCPHCFAKIKKPNEQSTLVRVVNHFNMKHRRGANPRT